jgi:hypothetical protein
MKIITGIEPSAGRACARALVTWEDSPRPSTVVRFASDAEGFGGSLGDAFVTACWIPALRFGERRIAVDRPVCPRLVDGLRTAAAIFHNWEAAIPDAPAIEAVRSAAAPVAPSQAAMFFTGGLDSLFLLHENRKTVPRDHPASFRRAIWAAGLDFSAAPPAPGSTAAPAPDPADPGLVELCRRAGAEPVAVSTNLLDLDHDFSSLGRYWIGAALSAIAHLMSARIASASIASGWDVTRLVPWGTHPFLDPRYGSAAVAIRHENAGVGRLEKLTRLAAEWPEALARIVVCNYRPVRPRPNCGRCYKCVETRTALAAIGFSADNFGPEPITAAEVASITVTSPYVDYWESLAALLRDRGRQDLANAAGDRVALARRHEAWEADLGWKGLLRRWDRRALGGSAAGAYRRFRGSEFRRAANSGSSPVPPGSFDGQK